ncbi:MAG: cell wall hydrolase [Candidatus Limivicinus sp.]|jgi:N-acetylmuramoyl-L-alanine amidase
MRRFAALLLSLLLCFSALPAAEAAERDYSSLPLREERLRPELPVLKVYLCSLLSGRAYRQNDEVYMSLGDLGRLYDIDISIKSAGSSFAAEGKALDIKAEQNSGYLEVNHRFLYLPHGYIDCGGDIYLPLEVLGRIFGITAKVSGERVDIDTVRPRLIVGGEDYYTMNFTADELFWLPRIAYVEAKEQPLAGIMGVCNVVLNRVKSDDFPDTIFEVLYDHKYGVQFTPAANGSIQGRPDEISRIAACLVLEGYNPVGGSLYFVNPGIEGSHWFKKSLKHVVTIGDHAFYEG